MRDNMLGARAGDFIVIDQNKSYILLMVQASKGAIYTLEEVTVPSQKLQPGFRDWQQWLMNKAPGNTCWMRYTFNLETGRVMDCYSFTQNGWCVLSQVDNLLATLLSLDFTLIPPGERKKVGPQSRLATYDKRSVWQPPFIWKGEVVPNVAFDAWRGRWPRDGSELSGRVIDIYLPRDQAPYPSHFPYWLEVERLDTAGVAGRVKMRVVDSGSSLVSPYPEKMLGRGV